MNIVHSGKMKLLAGVGLLVVVAGLYFVLAIRDPSTAATVDFAQKTVMRTLDFTQGDRAGLMAAQNDFTPEGWSSYMKHMAGFLDDKGAPLFSSEFNPTGDAVVIGKQNGVVHLYVPGTLRQTQNVSPTTYRVRVEVYAGGQPIKINSMEPVICATSTRAAPCS